MNELLIIGNQGLISFRYTLLQLNCDRFLTATDSSQGVFILLLVLSLYGLLSVFAFLLFLTLSLVLFSAFVTHGVSPFG